MTTDLEAAPWSLGIPDAGTAVGDVIGSGFLGAERQCVFRSPLQALKHVGHGLKDTILPEEMAWKDFRVELRIDGDKSERWLYRVPPKIGALPVQLVL